jgi:histidinol dehydrogenase
MPLEVVDARDEFPDILRKRASWDSAGYTKESAVVRRILEDVRNDGDEALIEYTRQFDGCDLTPAGLRVPLQERDRAADTVDEQTVDALVAAADRIRIFHEAQRPEDWQIDRDGAKVGQVFRPIQRVGLYAPAGRTALPSTVLMTAVPARVAGTPELILCTPPDRNGDPSAVVMAAARVVGIEEIYRIGGAQAIAAMAYGTQTLPGCDKVCGPGRVYTTLAKQFVYGYVGIDGLFGPSESVVVADERAKPPYSAAELLTQAEHDPDAAAILVTTSEQFLGECLFEVERRLRRLPNAKDIRDAFAAHGLAVLVSDLDQAADVVNLLAPEHLCIHVAEPEKFLGLIRAAGAALLGDDTAATLSDYCAGPSHVLPTARTARFQSGLGVRDFLVGINTVEYSRQALFRDAPVADALSVAEGLQAHRDNLHVRMHPDAPRSAPGEGEQ